MKTKKPPCLSTFHENIKDKNFIDSHKGITMRLLEKYKPSKVPTPVTTLKNAQVQKKAD